MDFEKILQELKKSLVSLFSEKFGEFSQESKKDIELFLNESKDKLERWTSLLAQGKLTLEDFEWLVESQKDLFKMKTLQAVGISKISLGHFKNKVVKTIVDTIKVLVF
ncbi:MULTISPECIES: hypothetical protein [Tenacibaculum]|uniref:Uncharacterized protein n=1 Tax=Tenacibaculum discolor TaxID=361581 RepID=A0A2G1BUK3_9FLAO|nr:MULTISPECIES: hypothetical protein [Tenacibaculum]MDP2542718.1 hypothetical protein [Tenacibaculum discolor]NVK10325.1 hypothetical protein [Tenacibaculum sp.]PHN97717.1 hypothetical protein CSC81_04710 [Tenacibaculum discolor]PHO00634.1 hypothetical protein CSC82_27815 [Rhodobacteraceae bacterium 4F10]